MGVKTGYRQTEVGVIPEDWVADRLGEIAEVVMGQSPAGTSYNQEGIGIPLINGPTEFTDKYPIKKQWTTKPTIICKAGDLLLCVRGSSTGRINISNDAYCIGRGVAAIRAKLGADTIFITFQVYSAIQQLLALSAGSTFPNIDGKSIRSIPIPCPPLPEQSAIATALSDADALIQSMERLIAKKRDIKQGAMQELLTGKKRLPGFSGGWERKPFGEVFYRLHAKEYQIQTQQYQQTGIYPVVDQGKDVVVGFSDREDKIFRCPVGGVIVFGDHTCIVKYVDFDFVVGADGTQILATKHGLSVRFFAYQLEHRSVQPTGYNRHFKFLKEREYVAPSLAEQSAIATILSDMDAEIAALDSKLAKAHQIKQGMMQELLTGRIRLT